MSIIYKNVDVYYTVYDYKILLYLNFSDPIRLGPGQIMPRGYGISSGNVLQMSDGVLYKWIKYE